MERLSTAVAGRLVSLERNIYGLRKVGPIAEHVIKLLRSCLCAPGQSNCDTRRPDEASSVDEAVGHLNRILGTAKHPLILQQERIKVKTLRSHLDMDE